MNSKSFHLPESLQKTAQAIAKKEQTTLDQFVSLAVAEKISALLTEEYIQQRSKRARKAKFKKALKKIPNVATSEQES